MEPSYKSLREKHDELLKRTEELVFLNQVAMELAEASVETGICWAVARRLRELTGAAFTVISYYRSQGDCWRVYAIDGAEADQRWVEQMLGRSPVGIDFRFRPDVIEHLLAKGLVLVSSLEELTQGVLTAEQAAAAERTLGIGACYSIPLVHRGKLVGTAAFVMPKDRPLCPSKADAIEAFASLSAIAMQRALSERERQRAEAALRESEARYRDLFTTSCDGIVIIDERGAFLDCNPAFLGLLGYDSLAELQQKTLLEITPPEYHALDLRILDEMALTSCRSGEFEKEYYRKDGRRVPVAVRVWSRPGREGQPPHRYAIVRDLSAQREMEESSGNMERYRILGELAAAISHEVRNPLTTVRGFLQHFSSKPTYSAEDKEFFQLMIRELDSATTIISDFLDTARPSKLKLQELDLTAIAASLCRVMESRAIIQKVQIVTDLKEPLRIYGDAGQIRQVLINILQNGLQAMPTGGVLRVTSRAQSDGMARVEIADTGVGIPPENLEKIGRPFFTTKPGGSGLGLSTCYRIIRSHRGRIEVQSKVGEGTTFVCLIPLAQE